MSSRNAKTLYLVDISSFIFRAYFAIRHLSNKKGEPVNAVYGVATMLTRVAQEAGAEYLAVVYDSKEPSFRKEIYAEYKANRAATPDDLIPQFDRIENLIRAMGVHSYRMSGIEADDLIATLTRRWCAKSSEHDVVVVSGDKDLMALVGDRVRLWDTLTSKTYHPAQVEEKFGVPPSLIRDYLALVGDSSDNIPGVEGIGPKSAVDLLKAHGDLEGVLRAAQAGTIAGKKGQTLKTQEKEARLSALLATLREDLPVDATEEEVRYQQTLSEELIAMLRELDFHTLIQKWSSPKTAPTEPVAASVEVQSQMDFGRAKVGQEKGRFRAIQTERQLIDLLSALDKTPEFGFDLETTSLNPRLAELVGVAIAYDKSFGTYIPVGHRGASDLQQLPVGLVMEKLKPFLENPRYKKIGQNLKYDWSVLRAQGVRPDGIGADTMVASYVLEPEGRHNLETLASKYLDYTVTTYAQVCGTGKNQIGFDLVPIEQATLYSAEDAWIALKLWEELRPKLEAESLMEVYSTIDLPLVDILCKMEANGVCIDENWLKQISREFEGELAKIQASIEAYTKRPVNLNSPKQLQVVLFEELKLPVITKTKTGPSTDAGVLEALAPMHEVPRLLLEYREISKLKGTYVDPLPLLKDPVTGKIHASFHQAVAATGRLSSSDPNLQNIPIRTERGRRIRRAFVPSPGNVLVSADYSQIELRILAHMSGDKELSASFQKDEDVHTRTASEIFSVPTAQIDERQRGIAKAINFGLMYGKTPFGLAQELKIPQREAKEIIDRYFLRYSGVKEFLDGQIQSAREKGWAMTLLGRKRKLPDLHARNPMIRANAERMAMNTPIQGTAADLIKIAMSQLQDALERKGYGAKLIIQVHDELVLDCPKAEMTEIKQLVTDVMENALKLSVPLRVNASTGDNWMEL